MPEAVKASPQAAGRSQCTITVAGNLTAVPINIITPQRDLPNDGFITDEGRHRTASRPFIAAETKALRIFI